MLLNKVVPSLSANYFLSNFVGKAEHRPATLREAPSLLAEIGLGWTCKTVEPTNAPAY
jgi:hypothetical protein